MLISYKWGPVTFTWEQSYKLLFCILYDEFEKYTEQCRYNAINLLLKSSQKTSHSLPLRASYGVSFVNAKSDPCSAVAIALLYVVQYHDILHRVIMALDCTFRITATSPKGQWAKYKHYICVYEVASIL